MDDLIKNSNKILDAMNDMVFIVDLSTSKILFANRRACQELGYTRTEMLELSIKDLHPLEMDSMNAFLSLTKIQKGAVDKNLHCMSKMGKLIDAEISGNILEHGDKDYFIATVRPQQSE